MKLTQPGPTDLHWMVVVCTPTETEVEFFELQEEALAAAREVPGPTTSVYVGEVRAQGEHLQRGASTVAVIAIPIDAGARRAFRREFGAVSRASIAGTLREMIMGALATLTGFSDAGGAGGAAKGGEGN